MELLSKIAQFVLMISILVILHEFGHYLPAKLFKIKVEKFFLFFDVKFALFKKKIGETTWGVGWLPLGGYVKIAGMIDESMDKEQMAKPPQPWEFRSKPAWQRLIVMTGGVIVNFLLGWFVFSMILFNYGDRYIPANNLKYGLEIDSIGKTIGFKNGDRILSVDGTPIKKLREARLEILLGDSAVIERDGTEVTLNFDSETKNILIKRQPSLFIPIIEAKIDLVSEGSVAERIGIQKGDIITQVNGLKTSSWSDFKKAITDQKNQSINIKLKRGNTIVTKTSKLDDTGILGVSLDQQGLIVSEEFSLLQSFKQGYHNTKSSLINQVRQVKLMANKEAIKEVRGLVGIVEVMPSSWNFIYFLNILATFSIWLGFINILPIPALDGGHVMFLLYEIIFRKKPNQRVLEIGQVIGFMLVIGLTVFTLGNDLFRIFF